ncbi:related to PCL5 - cyclin [Pseudozyma flocculosa]|nr:related to PCL5 - cyclin [Pseudozyma flocculosa]
MAGAAASHTQQQQQQQQQELDLHLQPLNHLNLASHITALQQQVLGQHSTRGPLNLPASLCGKRSRSNSHASPSSPSSPSSYASVFSFDNELADSGYDSQTSVEDSPRSRKASSGESQQHLDGLAAWRSSLANLDVARVCKKLKGIQGASVVAVPAPLAPQPTIPAPDAGTVEVVVPTGAACDSQRHLPTASNASTCSPSSTSSSEGKVTFVDNLVDAAVRTLDAIWNASVTGGSTSCDLGEKQTGLPLQIFVRETLRRGRTSCSTLQAALLYCVRLRDAIDRAKALAASPAPTSSAEDVAKARETAKMLNCPRRMFLAAVMVSSKFVQDRTYSNRAWCKISGLPVKELGRIERAFLAAIDYRLVVGESEWEAWVSELMKPTATPAPAPVAASSTGSAGRGSFARSVSDNVTGAALPLDTELRAASPQVPSQVHPKYRLVDVAAPAATSVSALSSSEAAAAVAAVAASEMSLPYPIQR